MSYWKRLGLPRCPRCIHRGLTLYLSAADEGDDFQPVARLQDARCVLSPGDQFEVAFDGHEPRLHVERFDQHRHGRLGSNVPRLVVDVNFHGLLPDIGEKPTGYDPWAWGIIESHTLRQCKCAFGERQPCDFA